MKIKALIFLLAFCVNGLAQTIKPLKLVAEMFDSIKGLKTVRFKAKALERGPGGTYHSSTTNNKISSNPLKVYFSNPEKKLEILYVTGSNKNKAYVKPASFPYVTVSLDPLGNIMRRNQHYTIFQLGFEFLGKAVAMAFSKEKDISKSLSYHGLHVVNGYTCHLIVFEAKNFNYVDHTVQKKETVSSIAIKLAVNDYMIRVKNDLYNEYGYLNQGSKITVPNIYAKKVVIYIEEKSMLPVNVSIFDEIGIFESYSYTEMIINKPFEENEFNKDFKGYGF